MPEHVYTITIRARPEAVFDVLVDLHHYSNWLSHSAVFRGTQAISDGPIAEGTRYTERSPFGTRNGVIVSLQRPSCIAYHQPMALRPAWLGYLDINVTDTLTGIGPDTELSRKLRICAHVPVRFVMHAIHWFFAGEIRRMHAQLKAYVERR
ncbi:SRPBCC family protein [Luteibacter aegosomaticola]|uniref:SRPBCC family protein n=1 Tax=Luteibacter aegosomaticola TaxID=2911538 RepID=UPI001FF86B1A|nr:SRPBCC family protein [Luteibacter aegosomaticola]UPG88199.1 SRPBCC family protein [Luteibacter aegosomaticola]